MDFTGGRVVKNLPVNAGDTDLSPGSGRVLGEETGNPLQYSCLQIPMGGGAWWATVHVIAESDMTEQLHFFTSNVIIIRVIYIFSWFGDNFKNMTFVVVGQAKWLAGS